MTKRGSDTLTYDYENRLTVYGTTTFVYDGDGGRVKKKAGSVTNLYIGKLYECVGTTCSNYIFAGDQRLVVDPLKNKAIYFYHTDHLGSSSVVTDKAGVVVENLSYYPYGKTWSSTGTVNVTHKYTGQELDDSTGLYDYGARYYDPALGRFISPDTIVPDPGNPQALNRYTYVLNNPLLYTDPSGHSWLSEFFEDTEDFIKEEADTIIQVAAIVGSVVCQICAPALGALAAGSITAINGGDLGDVIKAAAIGGAIGYGAVGVGGYVGNAVGSGLAGSLGTTAAGLAGAVAGGAAGGFVAGAGITAAYGGNSEEIWRAGYQGATIGAAAAGVAYGSRLLYEEVTGTSARLGAGENRTTPSGEPDPFYNNDQVPIGQNVVGNNRPGLFCSQGSLCSGALNATGLANPVALFHDSLLNRIPMNIWTNLGTIPPAVIITYGAMVNTPLTNQLIIDHHRAGQ
jgi:RHS repeat-associated protein